MIVLPEIKDCYGCSACSAVCGKGAITMVPDGMGFLYPSVDSGLCVNCGLCMQVCPSGKENGYPISSEAFGAHHKDAGVLSESQSGGVFTAVSDYVLRSGGVVYGVAMDKEFQAVHKRAENAGERNAQRNSKYIQSCKEGIFRSVIKDLRNGREVLFTGTPCECDALLRCVSPALRGNLKTLDIICHGVSSPAVWKAYLNHFGKEISQVVFRDKRFGWRSHYETVAFADGTSVSSQSFAYLYRRLLMHRPSCAECRFNNLRRPSDITVGDLWPKDMKGFDPSGSKGESLVILNTDKGRVLWEKCKGDMDSTPVNMGDYMQSALRERIVADKYSSRFAEDFRKHGIGYVMKRYGDRRVGPQAVYLYKKIRSSLRRLLIGMSKHTI